MHHIWNIRLKVGIVLLLIGALLAYSGHPFITAGVASAGGTIMKVGIFFCCWGVFFGLLRSRNPQ